MRAIMTLDGVGYNHKSCGATDSEKRTRLWARAIEQACAAEEDSVNVLDENV